MLKNRQDPLELITAKSIIATLEIMSLFYIKRYTLD